VKEQNAGAPANPSFKRRSAPGFLRPQQALRSVRRCGERVSRGITQTRQTHFSKMLHFSL
ncbi:hypothetical protein, partial [Sphingomonas molluscorum]|uniref:hypothetical protein n=1 Tax=Sphingomonas molluscorum TaxID=418184 RepID=UPI0031DE787E